MISRRDFSIRSYSVKSKSNLNSEEENQSSFQIKNNQVDMKKKSKSEKIYIEIDQSLPSQNKESNKKIENEVKENKKEDSFDLNNLLQNLIEKSQSIHDSEFKNEVFDLKEEFSQIDFQKRSTAKNLKEERIRRKLYKKAKKLMDHYIDSQAEQNLSIDSKISSNKENESIIDNQKNTQSFTKENSQESVKISEQISFKSKDKNQSNIESQKNIFKESIENEQEDPNLNQPQDNEFDNFDNWEENSEPIESNQDLKSPEFEISKKEEVEVKPETPNVEFFGQNIINKFKKMTHDISAFRSKSDISDMNFQTYSDSKPKIKKLKPKKNKIRNINRKKPRKLRVIQSPKKSKRKIKLTEKELTNLKSKKQNPKIGEMNSIQNELFQLDLPKNEQIEIRIQDNDEDTIGGRFKRRNRIPNIFNRGDDYEYIYNKGWVVGVKYNQEKDFKNLVMGLASKSKRKIKRSKSKYAIYEDEEKEKKTNFEIVDGIKTEIISRTQKKAVYVLHLKPQQKRSMVINKSKLILIEPRTSMKNILFVEIYRPKKDKTSSYNIGKDQQIKVKQEYGYSIQNLKKKSTLKVNLVLLHEV